MANETITNKILVVTVTDQRGYPDYFWRPPLEKSCKDLIWINLQEIYFNEGKEKTQNKILKIFEEEKPDYFFMFDSLFYDLNIPELLTKMRLLSPKTKSVFLSGDDDFNFDSTRYLALFFDYHFALLENFIPLFRKDGLRTSFIIQTTPFKDFTNKKVYDVTFIGTPKADRREMLEYLLKNNVNLRIFGYNWGNYPSLKEVYGGILSPEDYPITTEQTKINLCFSKNMSGITNMKGRFLEISNCKAFTLVEYFPYLSELFKEGKEIIFFKTKEELLKKIEYYLNNEKEREEIALAAYKKVTSKFNFENKIMSFIEETSKRDTKFNLPVINYSVIKLKEQDMVLPEDVIFKKIKDYDYLSFSKGQVIESEFRDYLQVYSLLKNKKQISCCDYFVRSNILGNYMRFKYCPFGLDLKRNYQTFLNINQILVSKEFFINNFDLVKKSYFSEEISFINTDNTAFISIPLVSISKFKKGFFNNPEYYKELSLFQFSFHRELYSRRRNPLKLFFYSIGLIKETLSGKKFIATQLHSRIREKNAIKL